MAFACPSCGLSGQVFKLDAFWRSLAQDAELKSALAPPPSGAVGWTGPVGVALLGLLALAAGNQVLGMMLLLTAAVVAFAVARAVDGARRSRADWERRLYCRHCACQFLPEEATL
ncbi:hypothetical protein [Streptacidiphilus rugosus]|uniref:hypothetical protein n=1 Tax=Streptacidiphilus rugosus TaxID=405783 RepID=UPI000563920F|nr:hypothetical protein [Streptacidiphilus rugosus]